MTHHVALQGFFGGDLLLVLGIGVAGIVALAAVAGRCTASAAWQAAIWRICTLSLFALLLCELTGLGQAVVQLCRQQVVQSKGAWSREQGENIDKSPVEIAATADDGPHTSDFDNRDIGWHVPEPTMLRTVPESVASQHPRPSQAQGRATQENIGANYSFVATRLPPVNVADASPAGPTGSWWLAVIWAMGTASVLGWLLNGRVAAWFFRRQCAKCDDETILAQTVRLKSALGIRRRVDVLTSPRVAAPVALGGWRPAVVLPPRFSRDFDPQQQETILAHELAHLAGRDPAWQGAALLLCGLLWWHPLVWWSRRQLRAANEAMADEASLVIPGGPRILAEALVLLGQRMVRLQPRFGLSLGGSRFRSGLGRRVERLLALPPSAWGRPRRARLAFAHFSLPVLMALAAIVGTAWVPSSVPLMLGETTMSVFSNSWRGSLVATALWTMLGSAPAPVAADDQPSRTPPAAADREKVEQQVRSMREKVAQLEKDGKHDEAEKLKHEAYDMMSKLRASSGGSTSRESVPGPEADKIRGRLKEIGQKVAQLEKDGKHDEAEKLKHEARALYSKIYVRADAAAAPGGPEREQLRQQFQALHERIEQAKREGKPEEVQHLMQEAEAVRSKLYASVGLARSPDGGDRGDRLQHLRAAAENLMAAGCEPEAQHVMQMIERMRADGSSESRSRDDSRTRGERSRDESRSRGDSSRSSTESRPDQRASRQNDYANGAAVQELRGQIEQLRRELREMHDQLNQAKGPERR